MSGSSRSSIRLVRWTVFAAAILSLSLGTVPAGAAPPIKHYTLDISPTSVEGGTTALFALTVAVTSDSTASMGSGKIDLASLSDVALDCGGTPCSSATLTTSQGHTWTASVLGAVVQLSAGNGSQRMGAGESLAFGVWGKACVAGSIDIGDPNTDFTPFALVGGSHVVSVTAGSSLPTKLAITGLSVDPPSGAQGTALPATNEAFSVTVQTRNDDGLPAPACADTLVTLSGSSHLGGTVTGTVLEGSNQLTISGVTDSLRESFTLTAQATGLTDGTWILSVVDPSDRFPCSNPDYVNTETGCGGASPGFGTSAKDAAPNPGTPVCNATQSDPICVEFIFPLGTGPGTAVFGLGTCTGYGGAVACAGGALARWLPNLYDADGNPIYTQSQPWTMIIHCDKSAGACPGRGVNSYFTRIDGDDNGIFLNPPACLSSNHDIIDPSLMVIGEDGNLKPAQYCTDYVSSHRNNAGDLELWVHLTSAADGGGYGGR
jgi:hypothetical protein